MSSSLARKHSGLMARTVREVLGTVFAPEMRDRVFLEALRRAGAPTVPEEAERARDFVEGPLRATCVELAGHEQAEAVQLGLDPILEMAGSRIRTRERSEPAVQEDTRVSDRRNRSTVPAGPLAQADAEPGVGAAPACVLMATLDRTGVEGVARYLVGRVPVRQVGDVFELVSAMDEHATAGAILVIDCCLPAVDPTTVATMLPMIPERSHVILWGATDSMRADLATLVPAARSWLTCPAAATHDDLASLIIHLMS